MRRTFSMPSTRIDFLCNYKAVVAPQWSTFNAGPQIPQDCGSRNYTCRLAG
jgi:hypothetical protein